MRPSADALDLGPPHLVAEEQQVRHAPVIEAERHARVDRVEERALTLDPEELPAAGCPLDDELLRRLIRQLDYEEALVDHAED